MAHAAAFQVGGFVAVDVAALRQLVDHAHYLREEGSGFGFVFQFAQVFDGRTSCFFVVSPLCRKRSAQSDVRAMVFFDMAQSIIYGASCLFLLGAKSSSMMAPKARSVKSSSSEWIF